MAVIQPCWQHIDKNEYGKPELKPVKIHINIRLLNKASFKVGVELGVGLGIVIRDSQKYKTWQITIFANELSKMATKCGCCVFVKK